MEELQWAMSGLAYRQLEDPNHCPGDKTFIEIIN
jgi:hypothetical protein